MINNGVSDNDVFVLPAKIGSDIWIANGTEIEYGVVEGYKITELGAYCYGSISMPRDDDPEERIWVRKFSVDVSDFGKTVFCEHRQCEALIEHTLKTIGGTEDDETLCDGCLSKDCDYCPKDDGYKCRWCPCDTCKVVDGKRTNWYN